jgi:hypothetical protein
MNRTTTKHQPSKRIVIPTAAEEPSFQSPNHRARPHSNSKQLPHARRCQYRTPTGRQCRSPRIDSAESSYCERHFTSPVTDTTDLSAPLLRDSCRFLNAQGINTSLAQLYALLAAGRISPRRATALAYIGSLLLHSLTAIDNDANPAAGRELQSGEEYPILRSPGKVEYDLDFTGWGSSANQPATSTTPTESTETEAALPASPENIAPSATPEPITTLAASEAVAPDPVAANPVAPNAVAPDHAAIDPLPSPSAPSPARKNPDPAISPSKPPAWQHPNPHDSSHLSLQSFNRLFPADPFATRR